MRRLVFFSLVLIFACTNNKKISSDFKTTALVDLFKTEKIEADFFSLGTDRGNMLLVDIAQSPLVDKDSVDIGNLVSTAAYLSYMQLKDRKMEAEKIRIDIFKKVKGATDKYSRDFTVDTLDLVSRYYASFHNRLAALKQGEYSGIFEILDKEIVGEEGQTAFTQIHDQLFEQYGGLQSISFAGFNYDNRTEVPFLSITGDYAFKRGTVPFVYVFSLAEVRIIGFYIME